MLYLVFSVQSVGSITFRRQLRRNNFPFVAMYIYYNKF